MDFYSYKINSPLREDSTDADNKYVNKMQYGVRVFVFLSLCKNNEDIS